MAALGLCCCVWAFSSCSERGLLLVVVHELLLLWSTGSRRAGLVAPWHVGSSRTRAQTRGPCTGRWIPNHCATREAPLVVFLKEPRSQINSSGESKDKVVGAEVGVAEAGHEVVES